MIKLASAGRVLAGAALVGSSLAVVNMGAAHAIDCSQSFPDRDTNSVLWTDGSVPYHTGPAGQCASVNKSGHANIFCYKYNEFGNLWYYAKDTSSGYKGWVFSGNVASTAGGPHARC
ncbi:hypothetical protein GCM10009745_48320 [Kribbella yunnanensis]|uniref:SH3 domain-containing protein n=1 Tax=Kribbella yunnanensis TaxID=190194 RepID=A0ABN2I0H9_9ACTN